MKSTRTTADTFQSTSSFIANISPSKAQFVSYFYASRTSFKVIQRRSVLFVTRLRKHACYKVKESEYTLNIYYKNDIAIYG